MTGFNRRFVVRSGIASMLAPLVPMQALARAAATAEVAGTAGDRPTQLDLLANIDPELRAVARQMLAAPGLDPLTVQALPAMRAGGAAYAAPRLTDVPVAELKVPVGRGAPDVTIYIVNADRSRRRPGIVHMHGGGFIAGAAKWEIGYLQDMARTLDCVIVTVEYRLAPEVTFRGSLEENYAALRWTYDHARESGIDPTRIAVMGESAGGGHAALLAIAARDRKEVPLVLQMLVYPMLDDRTASSRPVPSHIGRVGWSAASNRFGWHAFLGQEPGGDDVPAAGVPARLTDLRGLPPTFIGVGAVDLFAEEDVAFAGRLIHAGVATELIVAPGAFHGFDRIAAQARVAQRFNAAKLDALRRAFEPKVA